MQDPKRFLGSLLILLGVLGLALGVVLARFPAAARSALQTFPRSKWPAWLLTAACLFWVAWVVQHAALGRFEGLKPFVPVAALALFAGMVWLLDELLAPRALGGLLLLVANPMLSGVRWADSAWRYAIVLLAYAAVLAGCALVLHPWIFRRACERLLPTDAAVRRSGWVKLIGGALFTAIGLWQLR